MMAPQCLKVSMFILLMHAHINVIMVCHYNNCILQQYMPKPPSKTLPFSYINTKNLCHMPWIRITPTIQTIH